MHCIGHAEEDSNVQLQCKMWSDSVHDCQNCGHTDLQSCQNVILFIVLKSLRNKYLQNIYWTDGTWLINYIILMLLPGICCAMSGET